MLVLIMIYISREKVAVFSALTFREKFTLTSCYASPGVHSNPLALHSRFSLYLAILVLYIVIPQHCTPGSVYILLYQSCTQLSSSTTLQVQIISCYTSPVHSNPQALHPRFRLYLAILVLYIVILQHYTPGSEYILLFQFCTQ